MRKEPRPRPATRKLLLLVLLLSILNGLAAARSSAVAAAPVADGAARALLSRCASDYMSALSAKPGFEAWKSGTVRLEALGPGTHGWLATVLPDKAKGKPLGYLVLYAADNGECRLGEYGLGAQPLFDTAALRQALTAGGWLRKAGADGYQAVKHYVHPFAAAWEVRLPGETIWLDAKSAELLPIRDEAEWLQATGVPLKTAPDGGAAAGKPGEIRLLAAAETFDPYERLSWLLGDKPFAPQPDKLVARLRAKSHLVYVTEPLGDKMLYALSVIGYHRWQDGRLDLALDMNGQRFVPLQSLVAPSNGLFYR